MRLLRMLCLWRPVRNLCISADDRASDIVPWNTRLEFRDPTKAGKWECGRELSVRCRPPETEALRMSVLLVVLPLVVRHVECV